MNQSARVSPSGELAPSLRQGENQLMLWAKWRWFMTVNTFAHLRFGKRAMEDSAQSDLSTGGTDSKETESEAPPPKFMTPYESKKAPKFFEFYEHIDRSDFSWLDFFLIVLALSIAFWLPRLIFGFWLSVPIIVAYGAIAWSALAVAGFLYQAFKTQQLRLPVTKQECDGHDRFLFLLGERARRPTPWHTRIFLLFLMGIDAALIFVVIIDVVADLPRVYALYAGIGLGIALAFVLDRLNHMTGKALFREHHRLSLLKTIQNEGGRERSETFMGIKSVANIFDPDETGFFRRFGTMIAAFTLILGIAAGAGYARYNQNVNILMEEASDVGSLFGGRIDLLPVPGGVKDRQRKSGAKAISDARAAQHKAMVSALLVMSVFFFAIQFIVMRSGYKYSFFLPKEEDLHAYQRLRQYEREQVHEIRLNTILTTGQKFVITRADSFFASYYRILAKKAKNIASTKLIAALEKRGGPLRFKQYVGQQELQAGTPGRENDIAHESKD